MADKNTGDGSPNGLAPQKPQVTRMAKWPLYFVLLMGLGLLCVLVYSVNFAHNQEEEQARTKKVDIKEEENPLLMGGGRGLALPPPPEGAPAVIRPDDTPAQAETPLTEPIIVVQRSPQNQQEQDNLRRMKSQAQLTALSAPLTVKRTSDTAQSQNTTAPAIPDTTVMPQGDPYGVRESSYDPAADKDKEQFFNRAQADTSWILPHERTAGQPLELKTGAVIPAVMVTGINSDLPGNIIAQVSQNVFDTATGRQLLVPQGSKLFGVYDSRVIYGQERVLVAWNRLIFPDGSAVSLGAMPGADMGGNAGFRDEINNHYFKIFGSAVVMSLITGGMAYTMDSLSGNSNGNGNSNQTPTLQDEMGSALAAQLGQATVQLLQKNLNIKPTLEIRSGYQFNVVVTKDIVFRTPYRNGGR